MALNTDIRAETAMAMLNAISPLVDAGAGGILVIYEGTQPVDCATADAGTKLAELPMSATAFGSATDNDGTPDFSAQIAAATITDETNADATGTAQYFRLYSTTTTQNYANKTTCYSQGSVGTADADLVLDSVAIAAGGTVSASSYLIKMLYRTT